MRLTLRPRDNVVNLDFDVATGGDSAPVAGFDENAPLDVSSYWRANIPAGALVSHSDEMVNTRTEVQ